MLLPSPLDASYQCVRPLHAVSGQADLFEVRDRAQRPRVVKIYRFGTRADRQVWDRLKYLDHPALMRILDKGTLADGRDYEVMPYMAGGTGEDRPAMAADDLSGLLRRLSSGINQLHLSEIVHRDIKPANLLFTDRAGTDAVLADYGISRVLDGGHHTRWMTHGFAPPEAYEGGPATPAYDWWSLGMTVLRMATGAGPYDGLTDAQIIDRVRMQDVPLGSLERRLVPLCQGLLNRDPLLRWGRDRVVDWLDGTSVRGTPTPTRREEPVRAAGPAPQAAAPRNATQAVPVEAPRAGAVPELVVGEHTFRSREAVAAWIRRAPGTATGELFADGGGLSAQGRRLTDWLKTLEVRDDRDAAARERLTERVLPGSGALSVKVVCLLRWLDPDGLPVVAGGLMDVARLVRLCEDAATKPGGAAFAVVREWYDTRLFTEIAAFTPLRGLEGVRRAWGERLGVWTSEGGACGAPEELFPAKERAALPLLLLSVLPYPEAETALAVRALTVSAPAEASMPWYDAMLSGMGGDGTPGGLVVRALGGRLALAEQTRRERARLAQKEQERARQAREQQEQERERQEKARKKREQHERALQAQRVTAQAREVEEALRTQARSEEIARARAQESSRAQAAEKACAAGRKVFLFAGTSHRTTTALADTVRKNWKEATRQLLPGRPGATPPKLWLPLCEWARQLTNLTVAQRETLHFFFGSRLPDASSPEVKLLRLLHWLDPSGPPVVKGRLIELPGLIAACAAVVRGGTKPGSGHRQAVNQVMAEGVLTALSVFYSFRGLAGAEGRLQRLEGVRALARGELARIAPSATGVPQFRAAALLAAIDDERARTALKSAAWRIAPRQGSPGESFERLVERLGPDGLVIRAAYADKVPGTPVRRIAGNGPKPQPKKAAAKKATTKKATTEKSTPAKKAATKKSTQAKKTKNKTGGQPRAQAQHPQVPPRPRHAPQSSTGSAFLRKLARWRDFLSDT
ncbi:protein kinase domain-containing protein [Streptomyces sp. NBC_00385]|uniref:protein kinase domain-containing protein n=1 Tax=Streptomyces sp. NBC_00385 TaxID=2975733 RepID=UPI002DDB6268|nr:protein kinase [Streptomyces sp. NBC_00385]WRZ04517.1 protein kinase [Streptomyces sp. NBC_00385]